MIPDLGVLLIGGFILVALAFFAYCLLTAAKLGDEAYEREDDETIPGATL